MKFIKSFVLILILGICLLLSGCDKISFIETSVVEQPKDNTYCLKVHFIDVGQGDSTFIELPNGETMLIDAGEQSEGDKIVTYIFSQGYDTVNYVIATHPHSDHIGGIPDIMNNFNVDGFYLTTAESGSNCYKTMLRSVAENGAETHYVQPGDVIANGSELQAEVVAPKTISEEPNNSSIVLKLTYKNNTFLFTGDAEKSEEDDIWTNIKCDVLKVGHHGASTSTSKNFLKKTEPKYAVISCGLNNSYGHPTEKTLNSLAKNGVKVYRTDMQGTVVITSDGENISVNKDPVTLGENPETPSTNHGQSAPASSEQQSSAYALNTNTKKIHYPNCDSIRNIKETNIEYTDDYALAISQGYKPCQICKPAA